MSHDVWYKIMETKLKEGFTSVEELIEFMLKKTFKIKKEERQDGKN